MIFSLYKKELRANYKLALLFTAVLTLYIAVIITMFDPKLGESLNLMMESMPQLFAAFGMAAPGTTLLSFLANYLYGFLLVVLPMVLFILLAIRLVVRYVDRRSMACLLAAPHSRAALISTQGAVLLTFAALLWLYVTALILLLCRLIFPGELDVAGLLTLNCGLFGLFVFFGGLAFFASCCFNETGRAAMVGAGLPVLFLLIQMLAQAGDKWEKLKYCTPLTLFDPMALIAGDGGTGGILILYGVGCILFAAGGFFFCRRDIPV